MKDRARIVCICLVGIVPANAGADDGTAFGIMFVVIAFGMVVPALLLVPVLFIVFARKKGVRRKLPWVMASLVIGVCSFLAPNWWPAILPGITVHESPLLFIALQLAPSYALWAEFWKRNREVRGDGGIKERKTSGSD